MDSSYNHTVTEVFEKQALSTPQSLAVFDERTSLTYQQLNEKANQLAHWLRQKGVLPGSLIGFLLKPSVNLIICILGIMKAGAIYLPLDILDMSERLTSILEDARPSFLIVDDIFEKNENIQKYNFFLYSDIQKSIDCLSVTNLHFTRFSNDAIYLLYTSGSTGKPNGVMIPHYAVVNLVKVVNCFSVQNSDIVGQFINISFDPSELEIWSALLNGATICMIPVKARQNYQLLKKILTENHIDHLILPTAYFHQLIRLAPDTLDNIRVLIFGGEQANPILIKSFLNYRNNLKLPLKLINAYGPTEATIVTCYQIIDSELLHDIEYLRSIGKPIKNVTTYVLDEKKRPVNSGDIGELYISGINLALGYYNRNSLNSEKFLKNDFESKFPHQKLYKTGDLVKQLPNGDLSCIGRTDDQLKIQGFRIHLNEIENELLQCPEIDRVVVLPEKIHADHIRLSAYILFLKGKQVLNSDQIKKYLSAKLPSYMLPSKYVKIDEIPLTSAGKIDKKLLTTIKNIDLSDAIVFPNNSTEKKLKNIFSKLLHINDIDVSKNLFDLGLNSLLLVEISQKISQEFQGHCSLESIVTYPSIRKLSNYLHQHIEEYK